MGKLNFGMLIEIGFEFVPFAALIPYFFTGGTDGQKTAEGFYLLHCCFQFKISFPQLFLGVVELQEHGEKYSGGDRKDKQGGGNADYNSQAVDVSLENRQGQ
jgi:hypothetical protein